MAWRLEEHMYEPAGDGHATGETTALAAGERCPFRLTLTSTEFADDFHAVLKQVRDHSPLAATSTAEKAFFVSRYEDVYAVLQQPEVFSSAHGVAGTASTTRHLPMESDPPKHTDWRKVLNSWFTRTRMRELEPRIRRIADALLAPLVDGQDVDLLSAYTAPLPAQVFFELIFDLPAGAVDEVMGFVKMAVETHDPAESAQGFAGVAAFVRPLIEQVAAEPAANTVLSAVVHAQLHGEAAAPADITSVILMLIFGGLETTSSVLSGALAHLAQQPELLDRLRSNPDAYQPFVEESLRLFGPATYLRRTVVQPTELGGVPLQVGDEVYVSYVSANFDERKFEDADQFRADRSPNHHVAFGVGIHRCLGSNLARCVLQVGLQAVVELDVVPQLTTERLVHHSVPTRGLVELPARFAARG